MREIKYYRPEQRRYVEGNLQCCDCGNTHGFSIDLRLRHQLSVLPQGLLEVALDDRVKRTLKNIEHRIWEIVAKPHNGEKQFIHCANCRDGSVYIQQDLLEHCWQIGCAGCDTCGQFISKSEMLEFCTDCISQRNGQIEEDDCLYMCPYFESGLSNVRDHHGVTFEEIKRDLGYSCD